MRCAYELANSIYVVYVLLLSKPIQTGVPTPKKDFGHSSKLVVTVRPNCPAEALHLRLTPLAPDEDAPGNLGRSGLTCAMAFLFDLTVLSASFFHSLHRVFLSIVLSVFLPSFLAFFPSLSFPVLSFRSFRPFLILFLSSLPFSLFVLITSPFVSFIVLLVHCSFFSIADYLSVFLSV